MGDFTSEDLLLDVADTVDDSPWLDDSDDPDAEQPDLAAEFEQALADDHPLSFLAHASSFAQAMEPRRDADLDEVMRARGMSTGDDESAVRAQLPELPDMLATFIDSGQRPMQALAFAVSRMRSDDLLRARVDRQLGKAVRELPSWLQKLDQAQPTETLEAVDPVAAGTNLAIGVRLASGHELTVVGFVDFDLGTDLTDAFALDMSPQEYQELGKSLDEGFEHVPARPADVRARLTAAIDQGDHTVPPYETDSWPACRPVVEWALRMLPTGGELFADQTLTDEQLEATVSDFLGSAEAGELGSDPDTGTLADALLDFRQPQNDPLRWSGKAVEIFLCDYGVRKFLAPREYLAKFPDVLARLIRYSHRVRGVSQRYTDDALQAVTAYTPEFHELLDDRGRPGSNALSMGGQAIMGMLGAQDPDDVDWDNIDLPQLLNDPQAREDYADAHFHRAMRKSAAGKVGGEEALAQVDATPLPDEPLSLDGIAADITDRVAEAGRYADDACDTLLGAETKTVTRRLLHDIAVADPAIFRRGRMDTIAAALCWIAMVNDNGNPVFSRHTRIPVKDMTNHFGLTATPTQRAKPMLEALGLPPGTSSPFDLGSPRYLTSTARAEIIDARERYGDA